MLPSFSFCYALHPVRRRALSGEGALKTAYTARKMAVGSSLLGAQSQGGISAPHTAVTPVEEGARSNADDLPYAIGTAQRIRLNKKYVLPVFLAALVGAVALGFLAKSRIGRRPGLLWPPHKPSIARITESAWGLPGVESAESQILQKLKEGKRLLARAVQHTHWIPVDIDADVLEGLEALAVEISGGKTNELVGLDIHLGNMKALYSQSEPVSHAFTVTKFLGNGSSVAALEIMNKETGELCAMRIQFYIFSHLEDAAESTEHLRQSTHMELQATVKACGPTPPVLAAFERGIAIPQYTAKIEGIPETICSENICISREVQVMERFCGDLLNALNEEGTNTMETKLYIARRLLLEVLHLQEAEVSHNDLKLNNFFVRKDGSFLLGDFGSSTRFGETMENTATGITDIYAEPTLLIDHEEAEIEGEPPLPDPKSDMWSLGMVLYEVFMNGKLPYVVNEHGDPLQTMRDRAESLLAHVVDTNVLVGEELDRANVPKRWRDLICKLLEPCRTNRISAEEVSQNFRDLYMEECT